MYECEVSKINDYACTIINLRSEIADLRSKETRPASEEDECDTEGLKKQVAELENVVLAGLVDLSDHVDEKEKLEKEVARLQEENEKIVNELNATKKALEEARKENISLHPSTTMLDNVLASGRRAKDNRGLGYVGSSSISSVQPNTVFVRSSASTSEVRQVESNAPSVQPKTVSAKPSTSTSKVRQAEKEKVSTVEVSDKGKK